MFATALKSLGIVIALAVVALNTVTPAKYGARKKRVEVPRAAFVRAIMRSHLTFASDYYWVQMLQQIGYALNEAEYRDIYPFADLATDLDPKFYSVYRFGGLMLPYNRGRETWVNTKEATAIIKKGILVYPDEPHLQMMLAYQYMYYEKMPKQAADILVKLSERKDAPGHLKALATRLYAQAGEFGAGEELTARLLESSTTPEEQAFYEKRLKEIELEKYLVQIDQDIAKYTQDTGKPPKSLNDLYGSAGPLIPKDPLGGQYILDKLGRASSTSIKYRLELFDDAKKKALKGEAP